MCSLISWGIGKDHHDIVWQGTSLMAALMHLYCDKNLSCGALGSRIGTLVSSNHLDCDGMEVLFMVDW